jgi:hypothetical protein
MLSLGLGRHNKLLYEVLEVGERRLVFLNKIEGEIPFIGRSDALCL